MKNNINKYLIKLKHLLLKKVVAHNIRVNLWLQIPSCMYCPLKGNFTFKCLNFFNTSLLLQQKKRNFCVKVFWRLFETRSIGLMCLVCLTWLCDELEISPALTSSHDWRDSVGNYATTDTYTQNYRRTFFPCQCAFAMTWCSLMIFKWITQVITVAVAGWEMCSEYFHE